MMALKKEVEKLLKVGFIYPIEIAEWVSSIVVTPKKDAGWRVFVNCKTLVSTTKNYPYSFLSLTIFWMHWLVMSNTMYVISSQGIFN